MTQSEPHPLEDPATHRDHYVALTAAARAIRRLSAWVDAGNAHRDPEAQTWGRVAKIAEECGEVVAAYIGATGQNPRKGVSDTMAHVEEELMDVALTALGAVEHLRGNTGTALRDFLIFTQGREARVLEPEQGQRPPGHLFRDGGDGRCVECQGTAEQCAVGQSWTAT